MTTSGGCSNDDNAFRGSPHSAPVVVAGGGSSAGSRAYSALRRLTASARSRASGAAASCYDVGENRERRGDKPRRSNEDGQLGAPTGPPDRLPLDLGSRGLKGPGTGGGGLRGSEHVSCSHCRRGARPRAASPQDHATPDLARGRAGSEEPPRRTEARARSEAPGRRFTCTCSRAPESNEPQAR